MHPWLSASMAVLGTSLQCNLAYAEPGPGDYRPLSVSCTEADPATKTPQICTNVAVGGATAEGHAYPAALCEEVLNLGRPYFPIPVPHNTQADDPRLKDAAFKTELAWVTSQIKSTACACCHDTATDNHAAMWDISQDAIWTDQLTPRAVAMMAGRFDSSIFGNVPPAENNGFDRSITGAPTTNVGRMQAYFDAEIKRRGITADDIANFPPFGF